MRWPCATSGRAGFCAAPAGHPSIDMAADPMDPFDLSRTHVHLGLGVRAVPLPDFAFTPEYLEAYEAAHASDGDEGRLVCVTPQDATWDSWERHPAGEEVVFLISGRVDLVQDLGGSERVIALHPGEAV